MLRARLMTAVEEPAVLRPNPDPTVRTAEAVKAATEQQRRDLQSMREIIEARLDAIDTATTLRLQGYDAQPAAIEHAVGQLEQLSNEKFTAIEQRFHERDMRLDQAAISSRVAIDAALLAAKELVGQQNASNVEAAAKAERAFTKQIDQTSVLIVTLEKALTDRIIELKERMDRGEGTRQGNSETQVQHRAASNSAWQIAVVIGGFVTIGLGILSAVLAMKP